jgi:hypothetical protein
MSYLRFSPQEYHAIRNICGPLDLAARRPQVVKRALVKVLTTTNKPLADRLARFTWSQYHILCEHLRGLCQTPVQVYLDPLEVKTLIDTFGPLLFNVRFASPLKRILVRRLMEASPELAEKLHGLSPEQFTELCHQVVGLLRGST